MLEDIKKALDERFDGIVKAVTEKYDALAKKVDASHDELKKQLDTEVSNIRKAQEDQKQQILSVSRNASLPGVELDAKDFSVVKAFNGINSGDWTDAGVEKEILDNMKKKNHIAGDGSQGGYLIPTELSTTIVEPAIAKMPIYGLGIKTLTGVSGVFNIPTLTARPEGGHVAENGRPSEINYTFGQKRMSPNRAAGYCKISKRLLRLANAGTEEFVRRQLQTSMALTIHKALLTGTGADNQPLGLLNVTGFTSTDACSGAMFDLKKARQMKTNLEEADFDMEMGSFGYLTRPIVEEGLILARTTFYSGQTSGKGYQIQMPDAFTKGGLEARMGSKIATTTHIPISGSTTSVVYGDWSHFILALWAGLELTASDLVSDATNNAFLENLVFLKADQEYDCLVDLPAAFTKVSDAPATRAAFTTSGDY